MLCEIDARVEVFLRHELDRRQMARREQGFCCPERAWVAGVSVEGRVRRAGTARGRLAAAILRVCGLLCCAV